MTWKDPKVEAIRREYAMRFGIRRHVTRLEFDRLADRLRELEARIAALEMSAAQDSG